MASAWGRTKVGNALTAALLVLSSALAQLGSFPFTPRKIVFKDNFPLASRKREAAPQAANFALQYVASVDCEDLIFCLARWAGEGDLF
jgi:hypothetical protein